MPCKPIIYNPIRLVLLFTLVAMVSFNFACKQPAKSNPFPYSPDDFSEPVRKVLRKIEQHNLVYIINGGCRGSGEIYDSAEVYYDQLGNLASNDELQKASKCSNPTIRATALSLLMWDTTVNTAQLVREHMFDTAQVFDDYSEYKWTIISFMLHNSYRWPDKATWQAVRKELLQQNPLEFAAYHLLAAETPIDTFPGYYQTVKKMARFVDRRLLNDHLNWFYGIPALKKLASYQYKEDIPLIDSLIESSLYYGQGQFLPADVIRTFPIQAFEKYYLDTSMRWLSQFRFLRHEEYVKYYYDPGEGLGDFIDLLLEHKSIRSAILLEKIWETPPLIFYAKLTSSENEFYTKQMREQIALGVRRLYTPNYEKLIKKSTTFFNDYVKRNGNPFAQKIETTEDNTLTWMERRNIENARNGYFEAFWWE